VALSCLLVLAALLWLGIGSRYAKGWVAWAPSLVLIGISLVVACFVAARLIVTMLKSDRRAILAETKQGFDEVKQDIFEATALSPWPLSPVLLLGCRIGRVSIECGALSHKPMSQAPLPGARDYSQLIKPLCTRIEGQETDVQRFDATAALIIKVATRARALEPATTIGGIGLGIPGLVRPSDNQITRAIGVFHDGTDVAAEIAERLSRDEASLSLFGRRDPHFLTELIQVDNDVRCATRSVLSSHYLDTGWDNFACLHLGTGVGVGLVIDNNIYYGPEGWAGELGHIDLAPGPSLSLDSRIHKSPKGFLCSCRHEGFHFESMVNYDGLVAIAERRNPEYFERIRDEFRAQPEWDDIRIARQGWPLLLASQGLADELPEGVTKLAGSDEYEHYLGSLLLTYSGLVAGGLSTIVHLLDVQKIVLFGSLAETLHKYHRFDEALRQSMPLRLQRPDVARPYVKVDEHVWRGAALTARDAKYHRSRQR